MSLKTFQRQTYTFKSRSHTLKLGRATKIMGIVNVTPDSFSHDGQYKTSINCTKAVRYAKKLVREGADILDIGGESSRPGAKKISAKEELARVIPVIQKLSSQVSVPISIDTYKSSVAKEAIAAGAGIVNTIKGGQISQSLLKVVGRKDAGLILMHMKGTPKNMQRTIHYGHLITDIKDALRKSIEKCLETGIKSDKIMIDPGIGFGKTAEDNLTLINRLERFADLGCPILMGTSRKSFIGAVLNREVDQRLTGTIASVCASVLRGAHMVRVHDVAAVKEAVMLTDAIIHEQITVE